ADQVSIDPDGRGVVDGAAVQQHAVAWRQIGPREMAPIPAGSEKPALRDAAAAGLRSKRHANRAFPRDLVRVRPCRGLVDGELPRAIQRPPAITAQLGTWISAAVLQLVARRIHQLSAPMRNSRHNVRWP